MLTIEMVIIFWTAWPLITAEPFVPFHCEINRTVKNAGMYRKDNVVTFDPKGWSTFKFSEGVMTDATFTDEKFDRRLDKFDSAVSIVFHGDLYFEVLRKNRYRILGFIGDFMHCPQSLCLNGYVDAVTIDTIRDRLLIFKGRYYWTVDATRPPLATLAKSIDMLAPVQHIDTAHFRRGTIVLHKDEHLWEINDGVTSRQSLASQYYNSNELTGRLNFAFTFNDRLLFFKSQSGSIRIFAYYFQTGKLLFVGNIAEDNVRGVDDIYFTNYSLVVVKRWKYYATPVTRMNISASDISDMITEHQRSEFLFKHIFKCEESVYEPFTDYTRYIQTYGKLAEDHNETQWPVFPGPEPKAHMVILFNVSLVLLALLTLTFIVLFVSTVCQRKRRRASMRKENVNLNEARDWRFISTARSLLDMKRRKRKK